VKASSRIERRRREAGYGLTARRSASCLARDSRFRSYLLTLALVPVARVRSVPFLRSKRMLARERSTGSTLVYAREKRHEEEARPREFREAASLLNLEEISSFIGENPGEIRKLL